MVYNQYVGKMPNDCSNPPPTLCCEDYIICPLAQPSVARPPICALIYKMGLPTH